MARQSSSGLPDNEEEVASWLDKIDAKLSKFGVSNININADTAPIMNTPPQVGGIVLVPNMSNLTIRWNPTPLGNLEFYEINVCPNASFDLPHTHRQRSTQYTYREGDPNTTYYVRVRAKALDGGYGAWSGTLNGDTGTVTISHLDSGSATSVTDSYFDLSGEALLDPHQTLGAGNWTDGEISATYGGTTIRSTGGTVLPFIVFKYSVAGKWDSVGARISETVVRVQRKGATGTVVVDDVIASSYSTIGEYDPFAPVVHYMARLPSVGLSSPDDPGVGVWKYSIEVIVNNDSSAPNPSYLAVQPLSLNIEILELRN
jgi:hypothetical protein